MPINIKSMLLKSIGTIYEKAEGSKLETKLFDEVDTNLIVLSEYFKTSKMQAFFLALVFALNYKGNTVDINDLIEYISCNPMKILEFSDDFDALYTKGILKKEKSRHRVKVTFTNDQFSVNESITKAILNNQPLPELNKKTFKNIIDLLEKIYNIGKQRNDDEISSRELFYQTKSIINSNQNFPFMKKVRHMDISIKDAFLFLHVVWKTINGQEKIDIVRALEGIFENPSDRVFYMQDILDGGNALIERKLIEIEEADFFGDTEVKLSDYSLNMLQEEGIQLFANKKKKQNIIEPEKISFKNLFFNDAEKVQLNLLGELLDNTKLKKIQGRLENKNLPKGIAILLYGPPGTGKTESVYQLARNTKREIIRVDISQSKSMWFGESEKIIKRIFTDYKTYSRQCKLLPILLFNEADGIISKRRELGGSNIRQTENAIQNIILEELEHFEGIFFATTNLENNLDSAFERRFLFKIELQKPNISVKSKIWKSKLQDLSSSDCRMLADSFDFSGGQIDNIVRKTEMHEVINCNSIQLNNIIEFCEAEEMSKCNSVKIGYI
jgi:AAA+ superfamily predicted ATPase